MEYTIFNGIISRIWAQENMAKKNFMRNYFKSHTKVAHNRHSCSQLTQVCLNAHLQFAILCVCIYLHSICCFLLSFLDISMGLLLLVQVVLWWCSLIFCFVKFRSLALSPILFSMLLYKCKIFFLLLVYADRICIHPWHADQCIIMEWQTECKKKLTR